MRAVLHRLRIERTHVDEGGVLSGAPVEDPQWISEVRAMLWR